MITRQGRIDVRAPGIDAAPQAFDLFETVSMKEGGRIHAAIAFVIVNNKKICARPIPRNLLHQVLGKKMRAVYFHGLEFLARADVEQVNDFASCDPIGQLAWFEDRKST